MTRALILIALWSACAAQAADWQKVASDRGRRVELDRHSVLAAEAGKKVAWGRMVLMPDDAAKEGFYIVKALNRYDCRNQRFSILKRVFLREDHMVIREERIEEPKEMPIVAGTVDEKLYREICVPASTAELQKEMQKLAREAGEAAAPAKEPAPEAASPPPPAAKAPPQPAPRPPARAESKPRPEVVAKAEARPAPKPAAAKPEPPAPKPEAKAAPQAAAPAEPAKARLPNVRPNFLPPIDRAALQELESVRQGTRPAVMKSGAAEVPHGEAPKPPPPVRAGEPAKPALAALRPSPAAAPAPLRLTPRPAAPRRHHDIHWSYEGESGPAHWGELKPEWKLCASGERQSPIDIRDGIGVDLEPIQFDYQPGRVRIVDNGHTVQVNFPAGSTLRVMGRHFELQQMHFHKPSEERVDGQQFDMVAHLVHRDLEGRLGVVAVLLERGAEHPFIQALWNNLPLERQQEMIPAQLLDPAALLPEKRDYYTYMGSLTTPPCSEGVLWMVLKQPVAVSPEQIGIFGRLHPMNARPLQQAKGRLIKQSR